MTKKVQQIFGLIFLSAAIASQYLVNASVISTRDPDFFSLHAKIIVWLSFIFIAISSLFLMAAFTFNWRKKLNHKPIGYVVILLSAATLSTLIIVICIVFNLGGVEINFR